jgi:hypothetical protein
MAYPITQEERKQLKLRSNFEIMGEVKANIARAETIQELLSSLQRSWELCSKKQLADNSLFQTPIYGE